MDGNHTPIRKRKHPSQLVAFYTMTWYVLKAMLKNRATLFFSLAFPIAFVMIFALVGNSSSKVRLGIPSDVDQNTAVVQSLKNISVLTVSTDSKDKLDQELRQRKI